MEHIIREENMMAAQEILELFCELVSVRLPVIEAQKFVTCPVLSYSVTGYGSVVLFVRSVLWIQLPYIVYIYDLNN